MKKIIGLFLFLFLVACNNKQEINQQQNSFIPKVVAIKGYVVPKDSIAEPSVVSVDESKLKRIPVGKSKVVPTNLNIHLVGAPKIVLISTPKVITPGTGTFLLPKTVPAIDSSFIAKQPKPVPALPFRMKDAATCNIQYLDVDQGMNSSYIRSILEDRNGNIWFGTDGGGVSKFDGKSFTHYTKQEGLSSDFVFSIIEDKGGNIWFGTNGGGVSKYDGKSFTHYTEKEGLSNNTVWSIIEDHSGNLWFGTSGGGVSKYNGNCVDDIINGTNLYQHSQQDLKTNKKDLIKTFTHYTESQGLSSNFVLSLIEDKSGNIWFGSYGGGVSRYDGKSFTHYTEEEGLSNNTVWSMVEDKSGNLWFATGGGGVSKYNGNCIDDLINKTKLYQHSQQDLKKDKKKLVKSFEHYTQNEGLSSNDLRMILEDNSGNLWFGTDGGGVIRYDGSSFINYTDKEGLSSNSVLSITEDKSGNLWFGTDGGGVSKYNGKSFIHYTDKEGLSSNYILSIAEDKSGNLWFGTDGGGVSKFDGRFFTHYTEKEGLSNGTVRSIIEDTRGNLWFGTNGGGIIKYDGKTFIHYVDKENPSNNYIRLIYEDKKGNLWIGTYGEGVSKLSLNEAEENGGKTFTHYTDDEGLSNNIVWSILEDKSKNLWFGTDGGGVSKYDGKTFTHYTEKEGLNSNIVLSIIEDRNGNLWFGTNGGGVSKYDGKNFTHYTEREGLCNNTVWSILEDKSGNLWLSTEKGLSYLNTKTNTFTNFHKEDGLKAEDFFQNAVLLDSKNRMWWGNGKAVSMLNMNNFRLNEQAPKLQLNTIYLQENFVDFNNITDSVNFKDEYADIKFSSVKDFYNYPKDLELPHNLNHLTFHFSAIDWYAPHKIKYQYKLHGLDKEWSALTSDNKADYRNIPYGRYTFKVKAIGSAGKWSETFEYEFVIRPPWWHTWWAYALYILFVIAIIILIVRWNGRRLRIRAEELTIKVDEATIEIKEQKAQVEAQKHLIEEKHKEITDSINYAERIQRSFLATKEMLDNNLKNYFVFFKPKDIVSGDFYWGASIPLYKEGTEGVLFCLATADSTGHGVPGAIMSLLNITSLEKAIEKHILPHDILNFARTEIINRLKKDGSAEGGKDGMDCSLCVYDFSNMKLFVAAANNPVWIVRASASSSTNEIIEVKPDKMPVGKHDKQAVPFTLHEYDLQKGDVVYTLTDGFPDQFGGNKGRKFMIKTLRELLVTNAHLPMHEQHQLLEKEFETWKGDLEQVDDVTIIGVRI